MSCPLSLYIYIYAYHTRLILSKKITHSMTGVQIRFWPTLYIRQFRRIARSHLVSNICQCIFVFLQGLDIGTYLLRIQFETSWCTKWLSAIWISKACSNWCPVCIGVVYMWSFDVCAFMEENILVAESCDDLVTTDPQNVIDFLDTSTTKETELHCSAMLWHEFRCGNVWTQMIFSSWIAWSHTVIPCYRGML